MGQEAFNLGKVKIADLDEIDSDAVLNTLSTVVMVVDEELTILHINNAGEQLLQSSASHLKGQRLNHLIPADSPLFALIRQACERGHSTPGRRRSLHLYPSLPGAARRGGPDRERHDRRATWRPAPDVGRTATEHLGDRWNGQWQDHHTRDARGLRLAR